MNTPSRDQHDTPELRLLSEVRQSMTGAPPEATERMRHAVLNGTVHRGTDRATVAGRRARRVPRPVLVGGATLALAGLVAGGLAVGTRGGTDRSTPAPVIASGGGQQHNGSYVPGGAVFRLAARNVDATSPTTVRPGQYAYVRTDSNAVLNEAADHGYIRVRSRSWQQNWVDPQGMLTVRSRGQDGIDPVPLTPRDRKPAKEMGLLDAPPHAYDDTNRSDQLLKQEYTAGKAKLTERGPSLDRPTPDYLAGLPTDPAKLRSILLAAAYGGGSSDSPRTSEAGLPENVAVFDEIEKVLMDDGPIVPSDLRVALYRVAAGLPGIQRTPGVVTVDGHRAISVGIAYAGKGNADILFDPSTYRFVGVRRNPGAVNETYVIVTASGIVDGVGRTN